MRIQRRFIPGEDNFIGADVGLECKLVGGGLAAAAGDQRHHVYAERSVGSQGNGAVVVLGEEGNRGNQRRGRHLKTNSGFFANHLEHRSQVPQVLGGIGLGGPELDGNQLRFRPVPRTRFGLAGCPLLPWLLAAAFIDLFTEEISHGAVVLRGFKWDMCFAV